MPEGTDTEFAIDVLRRSALFGRVGEANLVACARNLKLRRYRRNETIFHQGDPGDSLYIVARGRVKIVLPSPEGEDAAIIATLDRGDFFGELALLDGAPHSASAVALEPSETLVLHREPFDELLLTDAALRRALMAGLVGELRRLTGHVEELHFLDLPGRLARRLVRIAANAPPDEQGEVRLDWPYTQSELAGMIGGARQSVNRLLADFAARDLIRFEPDVLVIPNLAALERAAER